MDRARPAVAGVAADVRAGQPERLAQEVDEQEARLDVGLARFAVDRDGDVLLRHRSVSYEYARPRSTAERSARTVSSVTMARL